MAKKTSRTKLQILPIAVIVLALLLFITASQYFNQQSLFNAYAKQSTAEVKAEIEEQAVTIATSVATIPSTYPVYNNSWELQEYVLNTSKRLDRDLVVVNAQKTILADTVPGNVGKTYTEDQNNEAAQTIADGKTRTYTEKSTDYPSGIAEVVVPMMNERDAIVGAVILSVDHLHGN